MTRVNPGSSEQRIGTVAVHAGPEPDPVAGAVMPPIFQTSTYVQDGLGAPHHGYEYARTSNPTRQALERAVASLEGGSHGFAFGSRLAALDTVLKLLRPGDHVVSGENIYGGTHRQMVRVFQEFGIRFDQDRLEHIEALASTCGRASRWPPRSGPKPG
ncbi:MAG TPA: PLP-dependent transferase [Gemmatimonadales bacterium]|nr:PLP-dependent transferase [Gemmatimonadales bacterium]